MKNMKELRERERERESSNLNKGITLIALIITVIILLILAGVAIVTLTGENGILERARLAKEITNLKQNDEEQKLENIKDLLNGSSGRITDDQYNSIISRLDALERKTTPVDLWSGSQSSGTLNLSDSIYNYEYLIFTTQLGTAITRVNTWSTMIDFGGSFASDEIPTETDTKNYLAYFGGNIRNISQDGKTMTLVRAGFANGSGVWNSNMNIWKIQGLM